MPRKYDNTISDSQLEGLAAIGLSTKELCDLLGVQPSWFVESKQAILDKGRSRLRQSLRRQQIKTALAGNATMQIWLGKQYLAQTENASLTVQAAAQSLLVTPTVLEQLQQSYTLTLEEIRTTKAIGVSGGKAGGTPVDRHPLPKTGHVCNSIGNGSIDDGDDHVSDCDKINTVDDGDGDGHLSVDITDSGHVSNSLNLPNSIDGDVDNGASDTEFGTADDGVDNGDDTASIDIDVDAMGTVGADVANGHKNEFVVEDYVPRPGKMGRPAGSLTRVSKKGIAGPKGKHKGGTAA